ncbi:hypothetical protein [Haloarchaeobius amylolyticus]|uniref:hypothetical protein n=1 Tax=Haloarchaeobius amylolyticus TaxID=1198296 RepID=UPI00226FF65C|nr:hypothetical protein [Haloarchaeobius amylolyticus]
MDSDTNQINLDDVAAILFEEFDRPSTMSPKAFYKLTYFINKNLLSRGYETDIDYFWYKYGTMTATAGSSITIEPSGERSEVLCSTTLDEISITSETEKEIRSVTREVLQEYERLKTEGLTERMYKDAPYDFQREYRKLDTTIQTEIQVHGENETEFDRETIRGQVNDFIDAFPEEEFSEYLNDLYLWYDLLSTTLDDNSVNVGQVEDIAEIFWTIIMLDLGTGPETGIGPKEFARELGIDDPYDLQGYLSYRLQQLEGEHLKIEQPPDFTAEAADAVMVSQLDFAEI